MPSEIRYVVDTGGTHPVVQLIGLLDAETAPAVRSAIVDVLARQPEAVVIDVSGLRLSGPAGAAVLADVARENADWPGARLALRARVGASLWHSTGLPVWRSVADAFAELGAPDARQRLSLELEPKVGAARRSRELVTEACGRWERPGLAGAACIVVTELVNNVVAHVRTPMTVLLALQGDTMTVAVRDHSATLPRLAGPVSPTAYGGRGLLLIDSVAERWGSLRLRDGKVVWAVLEASAEEPVVRRDLNGAALPDPARG